MQTKFGLPSANNPTLYNARDGRPRTTKLKPNGVLKSLRNSGGNLLLRVLVAAVGLAALQLEEFEASTFALALFVFMQGWVRTVRVENSAFLQVFRLSLFVFLIGRMLVVALFDYRSTNGLLGTNFSNPATVSTVLLILWLFVAGMDVGTGIVARLQNGTTYTDQLPTISVSRQVTEKVAFAFFIVSVPAVIVFNLRLGEFVERNSVYEYYLERSEVLTAPHQIAEAIFFLSFCLLIGTHPKFKRYALYSFVFLFTQGATLETGRRAPLVLSILLVIGYGFWRNAIEKRNGDRFMPRVLIPTIIVGSLPLVTLMNSMYLSRGMNNAGAPTGPVEQLLEFLYSQGVSVNLLGYVQEPELILPGKRSYLLGPLIESIGRWLSLEGWETASRSGLNALDSWKLDTVISFSVMPDLYLQGAGYGSSVVAESYADGGLPLVFAMGIGIVVLLAVFERCLWRAPFVAAISLLLLREIMFAPRAPIATVLLAPFDLAGLIALAGLGGTVLLLSSAANKRLKSPPKSIESI